MALALSICGYPPIDPFYMGLYLCGERDYLKRVFEALDHRSSQTRMATATMLKNYVRHEDIGEVISAIDRRLAKEDVRGVIATLEKDRDILASELRD